MLSADVGETLGITALVVWMFGVPVVLTGICVLKGEVWFGLIGLLVLGIFNVVGAIRLANPNSWWATRYDGRKLARAIRRFPRDAESIHPTRLEAVGLDPADPTGDSLPARSEG